jgi:hypothetical protein
MTVNEQLILLAVQQMPALIGFLKVLFVKHHPDLPVPTEAQLIAAAAAGFASSLAKDDAYLASHPTR